MLISENPFTLRTKISRHYCEEKSVGFVPTMGALHDGHASLVRRSVAENPVTVVSIFVNPTQFGANEDLDTYPRPLEADLALLESLGVDYVFTPTERTMYPQGKGNYELLMQLRSMDKILCGAKRPGHFDGVVQVVSKLFNIVRPDRAYFGEKDFQQVAIIRRMAEELFFPVEVVPCPIIREPDGLAMSSRNTYLNAEERRQALFLSTLLKRAREMAGSGNSVSEILELGRRLAEDYSLIRLDYFDIRAGSDLRALDEIKAEDAPRGLVAAFCGQTRLIDNMALL